MSPSLGSIRRSARALYREYAAIRVLVFAGATNDDHETMQQSMSHIDRLSKDAVSGVIDDVRREIDDLRDKYEVTTDLSALEAFLTSIEEGPDGELAWIVKARLVELAPRSAMPDFHRLPMHARVGFSLTKENPDAVELWLLEAKLFEDLCLLFNHAKEQAVEAEVPDSTKAAVKASEALRRAALMAAFNFLEAYFNGIAADYFFSHTDELDEATRDLLLEWNSGAKRTRFLSLRDKALQYPRIYIGAQHPPIQETNCPPLEVVLSHAKSTRDAIVHPSVLFVEQASPKEMAFFDLTMESVSEVVDSAIALVRAVESILGRDSLLLDWLADRGPDGKFSVSVFA